MSQGVNGGNPRADNPHQAGHDVPRDHGQPHPAKLQTGEYPGVQSRVLCIFHIDPSLQI